MQSVKTNQAAAGSHLNKLLSWILAIAMLILAGIIYFNFFKVASTAPAGIVISQSTLEEKYGLRVNLIAVTAAGGFVDVRIQITDGDKAKLLLSDKKNFPSLWINDDRIILNAPEETRSQKIKFDKNGTMFIMYVNSANIVKPGTPVRICFGDIVLEPINSK